MSQMPVWKVKLIYLCTGLSWMLCNVALKRSSSLHSDLAFWWDSWTNEFLKSSDHETKVAISSFVSGGIISHGKLIRRWIRRVIYAPKASFHFGPLTNVMWTSWEKGLEGWSLHSRHENTLFMRRENTPVLLSGKQLQGEFGEACKNEVLL